MSKYAFESYKRGTVPYPPHASQNRSSWSRVQSLMQVYKDRPMPMEALVSAIGDHDAPGGARGFVLYCCKNGWLTGL